MKLFVSNLSFGLNENDLKKLFEVFGEVISVKLITDKQTGRSSGFGFVEMGSDLEATKAIAELNNKIIQGYSVSVTKSNERESKLRRTW
jgi:RNA recognition motif-containing protein